MFLLLSPAGEKTSNSALAAAVGAVSLMVTAGDSADGVVPVDVQHRQLALVGPFGEGGALVVLPVPDDACRGCVTAPVNVAAGLALRIRDREGPLLDARSHRARSGANVTASLTPSPLGEKYDTSMVSWIGVARVSMMMLSSSAFPPLPARSVAATW